MCHCSKPRFQRFMAALPQAELTEILETGLFPVITTCFNCSTAYKFPRAEIEELLSQQVDN